MTCVNVVKRLVFSGAIGALIVLMTSVSVEAQENTAKSSPAALSMYADAANYQNKGAYELAADEWSRFIQRFPQDPLVGKAQQYLGVWQLQLKKFLEAAKAFANVVDKHPTFEQNEDAYLKQGWWQY